MALPRWRIYYADGRVVDSESTPGVVHLEVPRAWVEAPADGVLVVAIEDPNTGRMLLSGKDAYFAHPLNSVAHGAVGQADDLGPFLRSTGLVKFGLWVDATDFQKTMMRAADDDFIRVLSQTERAAFKRMLLDWKP